ncbi:ComF family protein [Lacrimispora sphenoides]|uniref:ComF family protein n=1 Tax=Lacrimispora sphenoides JCM 1415 TaxID=1297793 RepID=A0ABY1CHR1_9FIRM|nr:ComF family protein [Lacrimispora sphenoides]SEU05503.1 comF family protein [[Clostridium] sphenoides JCM 1415]SUY49014.1 phosphoribosyltransferase [Lacrimispora sphenoides]
MYPSYFVDLLFPRRCPVCDEIVMPKGGLICPECVKKLSFVKNPVCKRCGKEVISTDIEYCFDCVRHKRTFEYGRALLNYDETAGSSMAKIKYKNKREYLDFYEEAIYARYGKLIRRMEADVLVPVPVHPSRKKERGFNQAEILARRIGEHLGLAVCPSMLVRNKKTMPQKGLDPAGRLKNLEEAFSAGNMIEGVEGVILVDDIYTTGSTIEACTRALKKAGIKRVYFLAICIGRGQ